MAVLRRTCLRVDKREESVSGVPGKLRAIARSRVGEAKGGKYGAITSSRPCVGRSEMVVWKRESHDRAHPEAISSATCLKMKVLTSSLRRLLFFYGTTLRASGSLPRRARTALPSSWQESKPNTQQWAEAEYLTNTASVSGVICPQSPK